MNVASIAIFESNIESPLVTIAIPTYKRGDLLSEAVNSALNQVDFEKKYDVIVVDNNPERGDSTEKVMEQYKHNPLVSYYKNVDNIGMVGNWNHLYELAKGKYVVMLHDDDILFPYYLQVVFSLMNDTNYKFELIYSSFNITKDRKYPNLNLPSQLKYRKIAREDFIAYQWGVPSGMMILKQKFPQTGGFSMDLYPICDQDFIYRSLKYMKGCVINYPLFNYFIGENESMKKETQIEGIKKVDEFNRIIRKDNDNRWRLLAVLSYRCQMHSIIHWCSNYGTLEFVETAKSQIGYKDSLLRDAISFLFIKTLRFYLRLIRVHSFSLSNVN